MDNLEKEVEKVKKNTWWTKLVAQAATAVAAVALVMSQIPCAGKYYQPVVPQKLRK